MKYFFITIDTEGDNLWEYRHGDRIATENSRHIPRFQNLCEKYGYKPVYLVNHEMAADDYFVDFARSVLRNNNCEIGMHLHAWNSPPLYDLGNSGAGYGNPYLIEYPVSVMRQKFDALYNFLAEKFQCKPLSHRSGRWAMNQDYFDILIDCGIKIDCSVTPHISWKSSKGYSVGGSDYRRSAEEPFPVKHSSRTDTVTEIPVTIRKFRFFSLAAGNGNIVKKSLVSARNALLGKDVWLRPNGNNLSEMLLLIDRIKKSESGYIMFMLHSSELMPAGSPIFRTAESIEKLYNDIEIIFDKISGVFSGITLKDYYALGGLIS
jgi:hypothetical protein